MWIRFLATYCWEATPAVNVVFRPDGGPLKDGRYSVTRACAEAAVAAKAAVRAERPKGRV